jgi:peptide deformylase
MTVRTVLRMGDPVLYRKAEPVTAFETPELELLIADMFDTMAAYKGAGLAAPQIGVSLRVVIFGVQANPRYPQAEPVPTTILINPALQPLGATMEEGWEGCLSVPGLRGLVNRYTQLRYTGYDQHGTPIDRTVADFHARVVQHECDHLDGILYPMRLKDLRQLGYEDVLFPGLARSSSEAAASDDL